MASNQADVNFASRVAIQSLRAVVAFAVLAGALFATERFFFQRTISSAWVNIQTLSEARSNILLKDEQLTMSAFAFATTGDMTWKSRYETAYADFQTTIAGVKKVASPSLAKDFERNIGDASEVMHELEQLVLDLRDNGEGADAKNVFTSPRYVENKEKLTSAINILIASADAEAKSALARAKLQAVLIIVVAGLLTLMGFLWLSRRLRKALAAAEAVFQKSHSDYVHQLQANHDAKLNTSRMEQLGSLTATLAHELRNPLGAVRTSTFILRKLWTASDEKVDRAFVRINTGIERCDNLIAQLLEFSKLGPSERQAVDFDGWLATALRQVAATMRQSISVSCTLGAEGTIAPIDSRQMQDVLAKLLANSSEAMISRDGNLETALGAAPQINIATHRIGSNIVLEIEDNGHGIAPDIQGKVLDAFFTTKNFGAGLGLPAVKRIVDQHQGTFHIEACGGSGTTVKITLPAA
jgi:signal transduction histidine kinase